MKYMREFLFEPSWYSRGTSNESTNDLYVLPPFNSIATFLENRGWEIYSFKYIDDKAYYGKTDLMRSLIIYATTNDKPKSDMKYYYRMRKNGLITFDWEKNYDVHLIEVEEDE